MKGTNRLVRQLTNATGLSFFSEEYAATETARINALLPQMLYAPSSSVDASDAMRKKIFNTLINREFSQEGKSSTAEGLKSSINEKIQKLNDAFTVLDNAKLMPMDIEGIQMRLLSGAQSTKSMELLSASEIVSQVRDAVSQVTGHVFEEQAVTGFEFDF